MSLNADVARRLSTSACRAHGIFIPNHLPLLESDIALRPLSDIFCRTMILHCLSACSFGLPLTKGAQWIKSNSLEKHLTKKEHIALSHLGAEKKHFQLQVESVFALSWTLGLVSCFDVFSECDRSLVKHLPNLKNAESCESYKRFANLRDPDEILCIHDLLYCVHWAFVQARVDGSRIPAHTDEIAIAFRRKPFEWMFSDTDWDEISLET